MIGNTYENTSTNSIFLHLLWQLIIQLSKITQAKHNYNGLNETKTWSDIATCIVTEKEQNTICRRRLYGICKENHITGIWYGFITMVQS